MFKISVAIKVPHFYKASDDKGFFGNETGCKHTRKVKHGQKKSNQFQNAHNHHSSQIRAKLPDLNKKKTSKDQHGV